jgi:hypothetical protein
MNRIDRTRNKALVLALCAGAAGACDSNITDPDALSTEACVPPAGFVIEGPPPSFNLADLEPALLHAAGPMAAALGSTEQVRQLTQAIKGMADAEGPAALDTACRLLTMASRALAAMPDTPETLPDREGIYMVLLLSAGVTRVGGE